MKPLFYSAHESDHPLELDFNNPMTDGMVMGFYAVDHTVQALNNLVKQNDWLTVLDNNTTTAEYYVGGRLKLDSDHAGVDDDRLITTDTYKNIRHADINDQTLSFKFKLEDAGNSRMSILHTSGGSNMGFWLRQTATDLEIGYDGGNGYAYNILYPLPPQYGSVYHIIIRLVYAPTKSMAAFIRLNDGPIIDTSIDGTISGLVSYIGNGLIPDTSQFRINGESYTNYYHANMEVEHVVVWQNKNWDNSFYVDLFENPYGALKYSSRFFGMTTVGTPAIDIQGVSTTATVTVSSESLTVGTNLQGLTLDVPSGLSLSSLTVGVNVSGANLTSAVILELGSLVETVNISALSLLSSTTLSTGNVTVGVNVNGLNVNVETALESGNLSIGSNLQGLSLSTPVSLSVSSLKTVTVLSGVNLDISSLISLEDMSVGLNVQGNSLTIATVQEIEFLDVATYILGATLNVATSISTEDVTSGVTVRGTNLFSSASLSTGNITVGVNVLGSSVDISTILSLGELATVSYLSENNVQIESVIQSGQLTTETNLSGLSLNTNVSLPSSNVEVASFLQGVSLWSAVSLPQGNLAENLNLNGENFALSIIISNGGLGFGSDLSVATDLTAKAYLSTGGLGFITAESKDVNMSSLTEVASFLENNGLGEIGKTIFLYHMPENVEEGILLKTDLSGMKINQDLPDYYDASLQVIIRSGKHDTGFKLSRKVNNVLTVNRISLGVTKVNFLRPRHLPVVYPRSESGSLEFSTNFDWNFTFFE